MKITVLLIMIICLFGCKPTGKVTEVKPSFIPQFIAGPTVIVYKTKADYNNLVPVILSDDKSRIVSFPHPDDVKTNDGFQKPTELLDNYLLDNRGINGNVAFLSYTYEEYSQLKNVPELSELFNKIIDNNPLFEMCNCGAKTAFEDVEMQINTLIKNNELNNVCRTLYKK